jgi:L-glyceraldehyde 3-phosphate reductase
VSAIDNLTFSQEELARIDEHAVDLDINIWRASSEPNRR